MRRTSTRQRERLRRTTNRYRNRTDGLNGQTGSGTRRRPSIVMAKTATPTKATLEPDKSAMLRDQLLAELEALTSPEAATIWAHRILGAKNSLTAADARRVEDAFQAKLTALGAGDDAGRR